MATYTRQELHDNLVKGVCEVSFEKVNGEVRIMSCTLQNRILTEAVMPEKTTDRIKKPNDTVLSVWDVNAEGWRSFRVDSVFNLVPNVEA